MVPFFPKTIADKGILLYFVSLIVVSVMYWSHAIPFVCMALGIVEVLVFFIFSRQYSRQWLPISTKAFEKQAFGMAALLRIIWVIFSYFFYKSQTGIPFEFNAADALYYYEESGWLTHESLSSIWYYMVTTRQSVSDSGYLMYLAVIQKFVGHNVFTVRIVKALLSAFTCILIFRLASRTFGEKVARLACVFAVFMPNLIIYCGMHVKETEMIFFTVAFLERSDYLIRSRKYTFGTIVLPLLLGIYLFFFRTALGSVAILSLVTALLFLPSQKLNRGKRVITVAWIALAALVLAGGTISTEVEGLWNDRSSNQEAKRMQQASRGNLWTKYATGAVLAPMIFVMPFATLVDSANGGQMNQMLIHGGNYVRNFMGVFVLLTLFNAFFKKKNWRDFALIGSFTAGYLIVVALSSFASSERFLLPGLPGLVMFWAYGISELDAKSMKFVKAWYIVVPLMEIGWSYFKLGNRGML